MNDVVAERKLTVTQNDGGTSQIVVTIHKPFLDIPADDSNNNIELWSCHYSINESQVPIEMDIHGLDSLDALERAISILQIELDAIKNRYRERIP